MYYTSLTLTDRSISNATIMQTQTGNTQVNPSCSGSSPLSVRLLNQEKGIALQTLESEEFKTLQKKYSMYLKNATYAQQDYVAKILTIVTLKLNITEKSFTNQPEWTINELFSYVPISEGSKKRCDEQLLARSKDLVTSMKDIIEHFNAWNEKGWTEPNNDRMFADKEISYTGMTSDLKTLQESQVSFFAISNNLAFYKKKYDMISTNILTLRPIRKDLLKLIDERLLSDKKKPISADSLNTVASSLDIKEINLSETIADFHQRTTLLAAAKQEIQTHFNSMNQVIKKFRFNFIYLSYLNEKKLFNNNVNYSSFLFGYQLNWHNHYIDHADESEIILIENEEEEGERVEEERENNEKLDKRSSSESFMQLVKEQPKDNKKKDK